MTQRVIRRVTTKIEEEILADDGQGQPGPLEARLGGDGKDDDGDVVTVTRRGARAGRVNLALPPISRTRARTGHVPETEEEGEAAQAHLEDEGGQGDDDGNVVEAARGGARAGRTKSALPPIARPRARNDR